MKKLFKKIKNWYKKLPDKKQYIEVITAILSVPVMITVIIINLNNLNQSKKQTTDTGKITPVQVVITGSTNQNRPPPLNNLTPILSATPSSTPTESSCQKAIGPVAILSPQENQLITEDTVCINISTKTGYCPVIWSYQINNNSWSTFTDKDICLYNLTNGDKKLLVKIKSSVTDEVITLQRNFTYQNPNITSTPTASSSASQ